MRTVSDKVSDCVRLTPENVRTINWLPPSCGYRLVAEGRDLYWWHPLISGDPDTVHEAGVSVRGRVEGSEDEIPDADLEHHIVRWPVLLPKRARLKRRPKGLNQASGHHVSAMIALRDAPMRARCCLAGGLLSK